MAYGYDEAHRQASEAEVEAVVVDVSRDDSASKVGRSARPGRGSGGSSVPARGKEDDVVVLDHDDSDGSSKAASVSSKAASIATTRSAQSGSRHLASSAEERSLDVRQTVLALGPSVHRAVAAAPPPVPREKVMRTEVHPPHPYIALRQVHRSEALCIM